jgi:hypothetical protein
MDMLLALERDNTASISCSGYVVAIQSFLYAKLRICAHVELVTVALVEERFKGGVGLKGILSAHTAP